ncbi:MAG: flagellar motor switch protein FliG [Pseudobdellovibrio sp.]|nr:flagellar motor switch protein FliG [Pseudobdellovibrio sp.]
MATDSKTDKKYKNLKAAVSAMKSLPVEQQKKLIMNLISKDPSLAKELLDNLFEFEDISGLSQADFKMVWFEIPRQIWYTALRGASDKLLMFIRSCQTQRAFDELMSELKSLGPQPKSKVLAAQEEICNEIQSLAKQERIQILRK